MRTRTHALCCTSFIFVLIACASEDVSSVGTIDAEDGGAPSSNAETSEAAAGSAEISRAAGGATNEGAAGSVSGGSGAAQQAIEVQIVPIGPLESEDIPAECAARFPEELPGCVLFQPETYGIDCDGDGVPDYEASSCLVSNAIRPFSGVYDCDPHDSTLRYWVSRDVDGDGYGDGVPYCAGPVVPEGYVRNLGTDDLWLPNSQDCNDTDPSTYPGATDIWDDGKDSDCSGYDFPSCSVIASDVELPRRVNSVSPCASGANLYFSSIAVCGSTCPTDATLWGYVGNAGPDAFAGSLVVSWVDNLGATGSFELAPSPLDAGGASDLFALPIVGVTLVELTLEAQDCDSSDNTWAYDNPSGDLTCL